MRSGQRTKAFEEIGLTMRRGDGAGTGARGGGGGGVVAAPLSSREVLGEGEARRDLA